MNVESQSPSARQVLRLFIKLGLIGFGGPAAHIALMRREIVDQRGWLEEQEYLDLVGAANLIPGPSSTQVAIAVGRRLAGWRGLMASTGFIAPALLFVLALAWAYVHYGSAPQATWVLYGVKPVIIAVIAQAAWGMARTAVKSSLLAAIGLGAVVLYFVGVMPIVVLLAAAGVIFVVRLRPGEHLLSCAWLVPLAVQREPKTQRATSMSGNWRESII